MKHSHLREDYEELTDIQYFPICEYDYKYWFRSIKHNGNSLSDKERKEYLARVNETISQNSSGLPLIQDSIDSSRDLRDEYHVIEHTLSSVMLFVLMTSIDCLVAGKYFMLADTDYERRFMRGKMKVILNEGFKRLYGFEERSHKKSEWRRLETLMCYFPSVIQQQYKELTLRLDEHSKTSPWWRDERNIETHLDAEKLYLSRMEDVVESMVMIDSLKLFNTLQAVNEFLTNMHACLVNYLVDKYNRGEITVDGQ